MPSTITELAFAALALAACGAPSPSPAPGAAAPSPRPSGPPLLADLTLPAAERVDADGESDGEPRRLPEPLRRLARDGGGGRWVELAPRPPGAHPIVCDLIEYRGALYASHAVDLINRTGARVRRWDGGAWDMAFDYDRRPPRPGGQGLSRLRLIGGRLVAVDSDSTSAGFFDLSDGRFEAYLFVADAEGRFDAVRGDRPPEGTVAIPNALHSFDAIEYRGRLVVTGGTGDFARRRPRWPGGLWIGDPVARVLSRRYRLGYGAGVVRTTFMHRFGGRLYIGFQNNEARARFDLAVLSGDPMDPKTAEPLLVRVTERGGWLTRRFASGGGELFWVASRYRKGSRGTLFRSADGRRFEALAMPDGAGPVQDLVAGSEARLVLARNGLFAAWRGRAGWRRVAPAPPGDPFGARDTFCSAPLALYGDSVVAGATRDGRVWRLEAPVSD